MALPNPLETAKVCYRMAYFLLPNYMRQAPDLIIESPAIGDDGAIRLFLFACEATNHEAVKEETLAFSVHEGDLETGHQYWIVQYPTPPPVHVGAPEFIPMNHPDRKVVLAPYFSAVLRRPDSPTLDYYILGQAPLGGTTFRQVNDNMNANRRPGREPEIGAFLKLLTEYLQRVAAA